MRSVIHNKKLHPIKEQLPKNEALKRLMQAADISDFGCALWAYERWMELDQSCFDGKLYPGTIHWGLTPHGKCFGHYTPWLNSITLHISLVNPKDEAWRKCNIRHLLGKRFAEDALLHEMIHQYNYQIEGYTGKESHNCKQWCDQVTRIGPHVRAMVHATPIRQKRVDGKVVWYTPPGHLTRGQFATFPHSVRPPEYYEEEEKEFLDTLMRNAE